MVKEFNIEEERHTRDSDGNLKPIKKEVSFRGKSFGEAEILPMTYGDAEDRFGEGQITDMSAGEIAGLIQDKLLDDTLPDEVDADYVRSLPPLLVPAIVVSIAEASGIPIEAQPMQGDTMRVEQKDDDSGN